MMRLIIIGTLHAGLTPNEELAEILASYDPELLLVEIQQADIDKSKIDGYPSEMVFAYNWAKERNMTVRGFDTDISVLAPGKTEMDNEAVVAEQDKIIARYDWKDFNQDRYLKMLETESEAALIDRSKWDERERVMLRNIVEQTVGQGLAVVLTGCGHLPFFEKELPQAEFPFRKK